MSHCAASKCDIVFVPHSLKKKLLSFDSAANDTWFKELIFKLLKSVIFKELDLQNSLRSA